jgi:hypothetical protein
MTGGWMICFRGWVMMKMLLINCRKTYKLYKKFISNKNNTGITEKSKFKTFETNDTGMFC